MVHLMDKDDFTPFERQVLIIFIKELATRDNLSTYSGAFVRHLFLAYLKLEKEDEEWQESIRYTE